MVRTPPRGRARRHVLQEARLPFVCHGRTESAAPYAFVDGDGEAGFRDVTARLIARGHVKIAHLAAPDQFTFAGLRARGWQAAMRDAGLRDDRMVPCASSEEGGAAAAAHLLAGADRPTALVCATDRIAIGATRAAQPPALLSDATSPSPGMTIFTPRNSCSRR